MARKKEDLPTGNALEPSTVYRTLLQLESETFKVVEGRQELSRQSIYGRHHRLF